MSARLHNLFIGARTLSLTPMAKRHEPKWVKVITVRDNKEALEYDVRVIAADMKKALASAEREQA